jgi:hypothetical protein
MVVFAGLLTGAGWFTKIKHSKRQRLLHQLTFFFKQGAHGGT